MFRQRSDDYYVPTTRAQRERALGSIHRVLYPVLLALGMVAIPALSIAISEFIDSGVAHAQSHDSDSMDQMTSVRQVNASRYSAALRTHIRDEQIDGMKQQYLRVRSADTLRKDLHRYADDVAQGKYTHIPREIRSIIRDYLSDRDIHNVKRWILETNPSGDDLIITAKTEFAADLDEIAGELMIPRDDVVVDR